MYEHSFYCYYTYKYMCTWPTSAVPVNALQLSETNGCSGSREVRGVTAFRPSPNRGLRLGSNARGRRIRARDSGSSAYARTRQNSWYLMPASYYCCIHYWYERKQHTKLCIQRHDTNDTIYMARPSLFPRPMLPSARSANSACSLPCSVSSRQLQPQA